MTGYFLRNCFFFLLPKGSGYSKRKWSDTSVLVLTTRHFISVSVSPNNSLTLFSRSKPLVMSVIRTSKPPKYSHPGSSMYIVLSLVDFYREILIRVRSTFFHCCNGLIFLTKAKIYFSDPLLGVCYRLPKFTIIKGSYVSVFHFAFTS